MAALRDEVLRLSQGTFTARVPCFPHMSRSCRGFCPHRFQVFLEAAADSPHAHHQKSPSTRLGGVEARSRQVAERHQNSARDSGVAEIARVAVTVAVAVRGH